MELNKDQTVMSEDKKPQDPNPRFACEGCSVLLDINDGDRLVFARLSSGAILKIGNKNYSLKPLIGAPFGSLFQVETGEDGSFLSRILPIKQGLLLLNTKFTLSSILNTKETEFL
jgi:tRNA (adenine-N(1)-)-methyltransferase non-catalytic subunit